MRSSFESLRTNGHERETAMKYRPLGNTGITVSEVGFGFNTISGQGTLGVVDEAPRSRGRTNPA
jgi:hypothetical protein